MLTLLDISTISGNFGIKDNSRLSDKSNISHIRRIMNISDSNMISKTN